MDSLLVTGPQLRDMLISAAYAIEERRQEINELNVFPVPDGDTGTNMSMTMNSAVRELSRFDKCTVAEVSDTAASSLLRGARGNSGVILSLLFRGIARTFKGKETASGFDFTKALQNGVDAAYKAVMKPAEGTILTVARESAEVANNASIDDNGNEPSFSQIMKIIADQSAKTLEKTPDMLPVLKKAGVVDSGGKGLVVIFDAMLQSLESGCVINATNVQNEVPEAPGGAAGEAEDRTSVV